MKSKPSKSASRKNSTHSAKGAAVPSEWASNLRIANRAASKALRVTMRGR